ncbi:hypothetical protein [Butyrivibrio sp. FCS006]|uniref:hypothetical protein n=1 Tax=Butyrivibrio sp. FCS006 TaxID=1280684 RepID=UPI0003F6338B|nr:hypothetical protein [Butyrivibrio sp. FCS006]
MDDVQKKIVTALKGNKECLTDHSRLKSVLADVIPGDRIHTNLIMNAYDDQIFKRFFEPDITLAMLQFIPSLVSGYGISEENALWSVVTWCYVFSRIDVAEALLNFKSGPTIIENKGKAGSQNVINPDNECGEVELMMYKAGLDFPVGTLRILIDYEESPGHDDPYITCYIGKNPNDLRGAIYLRRQSYIEIKKGEYIEFQKSLSYYTPISIRYEKVGD